MSSTLNRKLLYAHLNIKSGCDRHRILYPLRYTGNDFPNTDIHVTVTDPTEHYHYYVTHGVPTVNNLAWFGRWKRSGGKWILSIDDDYDAIPEWNSAKLTDEQLDVYRVALDVADYILCSTPALAATVNRPEKTLTAPNLMCVDDYEIQSPAPLVQDQPLRVMWAGSRSHKGDLTILEKPIDSLLRKWGSNKVEFIFIGSAPDNLLRNWLYRGVHFEPGVPSSVYPQLINKVRPNIVLAPLEDCPFNYSKSAIRIYEAWSIAAAVIATPVGEYKVINEGVDGEYATTEADWIEKIDRLLSDTMYRTLMATAGRQRVAAEFNWPNPVCREPWRQVIRKLAADANVAV